MAYIQWLFTPNHQKPLLLSVGTSGLVVLVCLQARLLDRAALPIFAASEQPVSCPAPGNIPNDCRTDASPAIQAWVNALPDNAVLDFAPGCYRMATKLNLKNRKRLTFDGHGGIFMHVTGFMDAPAPAGEPEGWFFRGGTQIVLRDAMVNNNYILQGDHPL